ncbi:hypothetical protein F5Y17DRAFT_473187 [Xylariaceae sp. FL0594]|nr:hypothetical protein F5Y17DRAFT_473187 [Xylariaceae sp. FL0594]
MSDHTSIGTRQNDGAAAPLSPAIEAYMRNHNGDASTIIGALVAVLAVITVALRFYSRHLTKTGCRWDDWTILVALAAVIITDALVLASTEADPTGPAAASNIDPSHVFTAADVYFTKLNYAATVLYFLIAATTKLSILLLYRRLFWVDDTLRHQVACLVAAVVLFWIGTTVADLLSCIPLDWTWRNSHQDPRYCFDYNIFWLATGAVEAVIDILIILVPIRIVLSLGLDRGKKLAVIAVFTFGAFVIVSGIVKVVLSYSHNNRNPNFGNTEVWTTVHCGTGIICACLPVCWPVFVLLFRRGASTMRTAKYSMRGWSVHRTASERNSAQIAPPHLIPAVSAEHPSEQYALGEYATKAYAPREYAQAAYIPEAYAHAAHIPQEHASTAYVQQGYAQTAYIPQEHVMTAYADAQQVYIPAEHDPRDYAHEGYEMPMYHVVEDGRSIAR